MKANELRRVFTEFFVAKDHQRLASASLVPQDASLLFVAAGMVPFKSFFTGEEKPQHQRVTTVQKCVRAGGKHNDLDEVGRTTRHFTFFEMMGNFSFGDYFKETAIDNAWEFLTQTLQLDPTRLWVTVHTTDDEAENIWRDKIGVPAERIQRLDEDNWWRMADTGPNGPSSEIFWDQGPDYGADGGPAHGSEDRFIEIWNLVFMQFETDEAGVSKPLPKPSIDTGAGFERLLMVLQKKESVFEIDEMANLIEVAEKATGYKLGNDENSDLALRVLAEHARTMTFLISDGVYPSNEDRGYVLRRIMRRAIRFAYLLGVEDIVTPTLVDAVVEIMAPDYPELSASHQIVRETVEREEKQFRKTLATGSAILEKKLAALAPGDVLDGSVAFLLHDTYGFPYEVTQEVVAEKGHSLDRAGFDVAMENQREQSRQGQKTHLRADDFEAVQQLVDAGKTTTFVGRDQLEDIEAEILLVSPTNDGGISIIVDTTPFYAEAGGQIGDHGSMTTETATAEIIDCVYAVPDVVRHVAKVTSGTFAVGQRVKLSVDTARRDAIRRNHSATHMLHWALREVLGDHVKQQGSHVGPDRLRFDFSHFEPVTAEQIRQIEDRANQEILKNPVADHKEVPKEEAETMGAIAFFGDKYGETVRVLQAGPSLEFCGGTHVKALGDIGLVKIVSESSIGSNLRRVEAVTGSAVLELLRSEQAVIEQVAQAAGVSKKEVVAGVNKKVDDLNEAQLAISSLKSTMALSKAKDLAVLAESGVVVTRVDDVERNDLKGLATAVKEIAGIDAVVLGGAPSGGGAALVAVADGQSHNAGELIAKGSAMIKGGGGKGPTFAMAGGKDANGIDGALLAAREVAGLV